MPGYAKPLPLVDGITRQFWEGCHRHVLLMQKCPKVGKYWFPPTAFCPHCGSGDHKFEPVSGKGVVSSFAVVHRVFHPTFAEVPYTVIRVTLNEPERLEMISNIVDCPQDKVYVGMPVEVVFDDVDREISLPKFRPVA